MFVFPPDKYVTGHLLMSGGVFKIFCISCTLLTMSEPGDPRPLSTRQRRISVSAKSRLILEPFFDGNQDLWCFKYSSMSLNGSSGAFKIGLLSESTLQKMLPLKMSFKTEPLIEVRILRSVSTSLPLTLSLMVSGSPLSFL